VAGVWKTSSDSSTDVSGSLVIGSSILIRGKQCTALLVVIVAMNRLSSLWEKLNSPSVEPMNW